LLGHYFSDHDQAYGQHFYKNWFFTPFKENSDDYEELDGLVEENELREVVEGAEMDILIIFLCVLQILISRNQQFIAQTMKYISWKLKTEENWKISWTDS